MKTPRTLAPALALATAFLTLALTATAPACFISIPLEKYVADSHLLIVGQIQRIDPPGKPDPETGRIYDTAIIKVERVLRDASATADSKPPISAPKIGSEVPLIQPPAARTARMSTDILYQKGQRGVWLLRLNHGRYTGGHPAAFQPLTEEKYVLAAIQQLGKPASPSK